ncbi:hypothetical protein BD414DRAFT_121368 [Trametes punicea]|nr:hypothetical protein BD414DRAFT_121368 [Trametes punicea]
MNSQLPVDDSSLFLNPALNTAAVLLGPTVHVSLSVLSFVTDGTRHAHVRGSLPTRSSTFAFTEQRPAASGDSNGGFGRTLWLLYPRSLYRAVARRLEVLTTKSSGRGCRLWIFVFVVCKHVLWYHWDCCWLKDRVRRLSFLVRLRAQVADTSNNMSDRPSPGSVESAPDSPQSENSSLTVLEQNNVKK